MNEPRRTIWVDVEDLFDYARLNPRPSGVQRLAFEIYSGLQARLGPDGVQFLRHDDGSFQIVSWPVIAALFDELVRQPHAATGKKLSPDASPMRRFLHLQRQALAALRDVVRAALPLGRVSRAKPAPPFAKLAKPGDALLMLGATWFDPGYAARIAHARREHGLRTCLLIYDIIPLRRPEWCAPRLAAQFSAWFDGIVAQSDVILAISRSSADDLSDCVARSGLTLAGSVRAIPIGSGFGASSAAPPEDDDFEPAALPAAGSYVLLVATIEVRKNHALMVRVWQRLLEERPREDVPILAFAGRAGFLVEDLMQRIANDHRLDGKLLILPDPTDAALRHLYRGCLFTVFPSLYEGWGLPVTESFAFAKPCLCADATSLPEAGGALARLFNPDDLEDALRAVRATLDDRADLAAWEARVRREFAPVSWDATVEAVLAAIQQEKWRKDICPLTYVATKTN